MNAGALNDLRRFSTPEICNAIEQFRVRMRNEGYVGNAIPRRTSGSPIIGYAFPVRMRTASPPVRGVRYMDSTAWWNMLTAAPKPSVIVIEDMDEKPGTGSVAGEIHGAIFMALGAKGLITNGAVRDCDALAGMGLHVYASSVTPSHGYAHVVDVGESVTIAGLSIAPGDLIHGDAHGFVKIPHEVAAELPRAAEQLIQRERAIIELCARDPVPLDELQALVATFDKADSPT